MSSSLAIVGLAVAVLLLGVTYGFRYLYGYRVKGNALEITLVGRLSVYRIPVTDIESIQKLAWNRLGVGGRTLRLGNRVAGPCVLILKRNGWIRRIVITPDNPDQFIGQVEAARQAH